MIYIHSGNDVDLGAGTGDSDGMTEIIASGNFLRLVKNGRWEYAQRTNATGAVAIIAVNSDGNLILVEQHRAALNAQVLELPAGLVGDEGEESLESAARRELLEETGYVASRLELVAQGPSSAGLSDEIITFFFTDSITRAGAGGGIGDEQITVQEWHPQTLMQKLTTMPDGHQVDVKIHTALYLMLVRGLIKT